MERNQTKVLIYYYDEHMIVGREIMTSVNGIQRETMREIRQTEETG